MHGQQNIKTFHLYSRIKPSPVAFLDAFKQMSGTRQRPYPQKFPPTHSALVVDMQITDNKNCTYSNALH